MSERKNQKHPNMSTKEWLLGQKLMIFYQDNSDFLVNTLYPLNNESHDLSLRMINWVVTNYVKKHPIRYRIRDRIFDLDSVYKQELQTWRKSLFDPFRRGNKVSLELPNGQILRTTFPQLNFFRWCKQYHVIQYIRNHHDEIQDAMKQWQEEKRGKRKAKSKSPPDQVNQWAFLSIGEHVISPTSS